MPPKLIPLNVVTRSAIEVLRDPPKLPIPAKSHSDSRPKNEKPRPAGVLPDGTLDIPIVWEGA